jgi:hypothetical protein
MADIQEAIQDAIQDKIYEFEDLSESSGTAWVDADEWVDADDWED